MPGSPCLTGWEGAGEEQGPEVETLASSGASRVAGEAAAAVLETAAASSSTPKENKNEETDKLANKYRWGLACDGGDDRLKELLLWTLHFTTLLIEHSFSRHLYSSMEHLTTLLASSDLDVVLAVLNLLYMFRFVIELINCLSLR